MFVVYLIRIIVRWFRPEARKRDHLWRTDPKAYYEAIDRDADSLEP